MVVGAALIIELATRLCIERMRHQSIMVIFRALTLPSKIVRGCLVVCLVLFVCVSVFVWLCFVLDTIST